MRNPFFMAREDPGAGPGRHGGFPRCSLVRPIPHRLHAARFPARGRGVRARVTSTRAMEVQMAEETGQVTGTKDKDYNIIWFTEQCLSNVLRLEQYAQDAERDGDQELAGFFRRAQGASRNGAEQGKELLRGRLSG